jgi:hypothetical protein
MTTTSTGRYRCAGESHYYLIDPNTGDVRNLGSATLVTEEFLYDGDELVQLPPWRGAATGLNLQQRLPSMML